jgi:NAD(P)-dependent dehydrogenase (short-subunit alcohol dehydrogenase family)
MCKAVQEQMVKQGGGSIVNLSSIYGLVGRPRELGTGLDPYVHSKGGVVQLTRDMAVHFARDGVGVNAPCPGFVFHPVAMRGNVPAMVKRRATTTATKGMSTAAQRITNAKSKP